MKDPKFIIGVLFGGFTISAILGIVIAVFIEIIKDLKNSR